MAALLVGWWMRCAYPPTALNRTVVSSAGTPRGGVHRIKASDVFTPDPGAPFAHLYYWAPFILIGNAS